MGPQKIQAGFWIERDNYHRRSIRNNLEAGNPNGRVLDNEIVNLRVNYNSINDTRQLFFQDSITLADGKLVLKLTERSDYSLANLNPRKLPDDIPPGRAFRSETAIEVQIARYRAAARYLSRFESSPRNWELVDAVVLHETPVLRNVLYLLRG